MLSELAQSLAPVTTPGPSFESYLPYLIVVVFGVDRALMYLKARGVDLVGMSETLRELKADSKLLVEWHSSTDSQGRKAWYFPLEFLDSIKALTESVSALTELLREFRLELKETKLAVDRIEAKVSRV